MPDGHLSREYVENPQEELGNIAVILTTLLSLEVEDSSIQRWTARWMNGWMDFSFDTDQDLM